MGIIDNDSIFQQVKGNIGGGYYIRHVKGKAILSRCPVRKKMKRGPLMPKQNRKFCRASSYAVNILKDPEKKAYYASKAKGTNNAYTMAISDYMQHWERPENMMEPGWEHKIFRAD